MLSLVIPSRNNLKYVQFAYESIRKHLGNTVEVILLDDASTDGTWDWMQGIKTTSNAQIYRNEGPERVGHTVLYDKGAELATNPVFGIFHADMVATPNYIKNMMKHIKPGVVVSGTRIEPPLHPPGPEKHVVDFGMEPEHFKEHDFLSTVQTLEFSEHDKVTNGVFAPWIIHKEDFFKIGGHDKRLFAPMELEDSDLFNRFLLNGYKLIQSRDAFVYHMTCRGSRYKDGIQIVQAIPLGNGHVWMRAADSEEYTKLRQNKFREWWRKWHMDVLHDSNMLPIVHPRYDTGFMIENCPIELLGLLEPWCDSIYLDDDKIIEEYIRLEQPQTKFDLSKRVFNADRGTGKDVLVTFDAKDFTMEHMKAIKELPLMIADSGESGTVMEYDIFDLDLGNLCRKEQFLVDANNPWYTEKLLPQPWLS